MDIGFEIFKVTVDLLKGTQWFLITAFITIFFRTEICSLLKKFAEMKSWRFGDKVVDFNLGEQQKIEVEHPSASHELKPLPGFSRNPAIAELEVALHAELAKKQNSNKIDLLIRLLAENRLELNFERIYQAIFGSQIRWLRILNGRTHITMVEAKEFFLGYKKDYPPTLKKYDFDIWFGYLINTRLINKNETTLEITDQGRYFLTYITEMGRPEDKFW